MNVILRLYNDLTLDQFCDLLQAIRLNVRIYFGFENDSKALKMSN